MRLATFFLVFVISQADLAMYRTRVQCHAHRVEKERNIRVRVSNIRKRQFDKPYLSDRQPNNCWQLRQERTLIRLSDRLPLRANLPWLLADLNST
jgi:hypothetical protein